MAQVLELAQLVQQHRVTQVQVGRGGVESRLDTQRTPGLQACGEFIDFKDLVGTAADQFEGGFKAGGGMDGHGGSGSWLKG